jgi:glycerol kinase
LGLDTAAAGCLRAATVVTAMTWQDRNSPAHAVSGVDPAGLVRCEEYTLDAAPGGYHSHVPRYLGALDQGTTSTRFIVFDDAARIVSQAQREHAQIYPQPGWVEHDPAEIWRNTQEVMAEALRRGDLAPRDLAAVGVTNQRETTVVWNRHTGAPLHHAIVWQDTRVGNDVTACATRYGVEFFRQRTGLPPSTYFSAFKLRWLLEHVPGLRDAARAGDVLFGTMDSFLVWNLTGGAAGGRHITDVTNASRTLLMNLHTLKWDGGLLDLFDIPAAMLPAIRSSSELHGVAAVDPLRAVRIAGVLGDQQAALVGQTCFAVGEAKNTYGTGCFLLMNTGARPVHSRAGLLTTVAYRFGDAPACYALEGSVAVAGAAVQWLRDNIGLIAESADVERLAHTVADNGGVYFVPAFSGLYAPYWNDAARGTILGLTRFSTGGHIARAALEATAFQTWDVLEAMERDSGLRQPVLRADGGMTVNGLLMQFQSDIVDRPVIRATIAETTALGAAFAAGLAVGVFQDGDDLRARRTQGARWGPTMTGERRAELLRRWRQAVGRAVDWSNA